MTLQFYVGNAKIFSSDQLKTYDYFSLSYIRWGLVVGTIAFWLFQKDQKYTICFPWVKFSEVSQSITFFRALGATKWYFFYKPLGEYLKCFKS